MSGFGKVIKADEATKAMIDLIVFRCQITIDSIREIPQNLSIVLGEESFLVIIYIEIELGESRG